MTTRNTPQATAKPGDAPSPNYTRRRCIRNNMFIIMTWPGYGMH